MQKKTKTLVNFILDKSGSMESVRSATISGFNEYLQTLQKDQKSKYEFSLTLFDTEIYQKWSADPIEKVKKLDLESYNPSGGTALYDAVCRTIKEAEGKVKENQKVLTVIMTDGQENSSREYTEVQMKEMISRLEKEGNWTFVYLGANQDSYATAQKFGINTQNTTNFNATSRGVHASMSTVAVNTVAFAGNDTLTGQAFFSSEDQDKLGKTK